MCQSDIQLAKFTAQKKFGLCLYLWSQLALSLHYPLKAGDLNNLYCQQTGIFSGDLNVCCNVSEKFEYLEEY
jgi:hypothetical protein